MDLPDHLINTGVGETRVLHNCGFLWNSFHNTLPISLVSICWIKPWSFRLRCTKIFRELWFQSCILSPFLTGTYNHYPYFTEIILLYSSNRASNVLFELKLPSQEKRLLNQKSKPFFSEYWQYYSKLDHRIIE